MPPTPRSGTTGGRAGVSLSRATTVTATTTTSITSASSRQDRRISRDDMFLGSRKGRLTASEKRISRDDLYLGMRPSAVGGGGACSRLLPHRGSAEKLSIPEEEKTPNSTMSAVPARMAAPESAVVGEIQIGMALGSPAHPPSHLRTRPPSQEHPTWTMSSRAPRDATAQPSEAGLSSPEAASPAAAPVSSVTSATSCASAPVSGGSLQRTKTGRRKLFGIFGSRRYQEPAASPAAASAAQDTTKATSTGASPTADSRAAAAGSATSSAAAAPDQPRPSVSSRNGTKKYQPIVVPTMDPDLALSSAQTSRTSNTAKDPRTRPLLRSKTSEPAVSQRPGVESGSVAAAMAASSGNKSGVPSIATSPYLNVEIPEFHLERYSVMFGNVLNQDSCASPESSAWQPASSLLARRQATLDRLKMINRGVLQEDPDCAVADKAALRPPQPLQRRATSPRLANSAASSRLPGRPLGEANPGSAGAGAHDSATAAAAPVGVALSSPRFRANTSPSMIRPPAAPATQKQSRWMNPLRGNPTSYAAAPKRAATVTATSSSAGPRTAHYEPMLSSSIMESPTDMDYSAAGEEEDDDQKSVRLVQPFKPVLAEPQWQIVSPLPSTTSPSSAGSSGSSSTSNSMSNSASNSTGSSNSSVALDEEQERLLQSAVEMSIARQISISHQQRQLLRPLQTSSANAAAAASHGSGKGGGDGSANKNFPSPAMSSPSSRSAVSAIRLGRNERLQETRMATPTLVLAETTMATAGPSQNKQPLQQQNDDWLKAPYQQNTYFASARYNGNSPTVMQPAQNRKSELVVLEAA